MPKLSHTLCAFCLAFVVTMTMLPQAAAAQAVNIHIGPAVEQPQFDSSFDNATTADTPASTCLPDGTQASGAIYRLCMPAPEKYNGDLVIWAHGYVAFNQPVEIPEDQLCLAPDQCLPDIVNGLGFGFITTSYSVNGLAVLQGLDDVVDLVDIYTALQGAPNRVFVIGASEGGLITALAVERYPQLFTGGLSMCGPVGDFIRQIGFNGDFRVAFDYYFPGLIPGSPIQIPPELIANWDAYYAEKVAPVVFNKRNRSKVREFAAVANLARDEKDFWGSIETSIKDGLWYSVFATGDAMAKLGGQPYDNQSRIYSGSRNDLRLNRQIARYSADVAAVNEMQSRYQTTGQLIAPLVTLHTLQDQQVPYWHEQLYQLKVAANSAQSMHVNIPINRYEHCNFKLFEPIVGFAILYYKATGELFSPTQLQAVLKDKDSRHSFRSMAVSYGLPY